MRGQRVSFYWGGLLILLLAGLILVGFNTRGIAQGSEENSKVRSDIVTIDKMAELGKLELPPVTFLHDKHTEALSEEERPCLACHNENEEDKSLDFNFMKTAEASGTAQMKEAFHEGCISCHEEKLDQDKDSGPTEGECRSCHSENPPASNRQPVGLGKVLHYRHVAAEQIPDMKLSGQEDENCGRCHHKYDKEAEKLVPETEEEGSCRYCHKAEPYKMEGADVTVSSLPDASHLQCVNCHRELEILDAEKTGPVECASCHGIVGQKRIESDNEEFMKKMGGELPRLERGQPDAALVTAMQPEEYMALRQEDQPSTMSPVPFDHVAHERAVENCRSCHHEAIKSCNSCHSIPGKEEGDFIQLSDAMHMSDSEASCVGCHNVQKQEPVCAGCHAAMEVEPFLDEQSCYQCHPENIEEGREPMRMSTESQNEMAASMLEARADKPGLYPEDDIPETVKIDAMVDEYKAAEFPHRRIVNYLAEQVGESGMGGYFHAEEGLLCQGCHHNSPVSKNPPSCVSCHGKPFDESGSGRPGLKAAYHGQCMDCHSAMGIEGKEIVKGKPVPANTDCTGCHEENK